MKLPRTRAMTSSMYDCATSSAVAIPKRGKRKSGDMEVTGMGTACVIHQANTHTRTASIFRLVTAAGDPSSFTNTQTRPHNRGPNRIQKLLSVKMERGAVLKLRDLCITGSSRGRRGSLDSFTVSWLFILDGKSRRKDGESLCFYKLDNDGKVISWLLPRMVVDGDMISFEDWF
nr:Os08g0503600 [Ipomoea batatas]